MTARSTSASTSLRRWLLAASAVAVLAPLHAQAGGDAEATYRRVVLGDAGAPTAVPAAPAQRIEERLVPGANARHLMYLGVDRERAIAEARAAGEVPTRQLLSITTRTLSDVEKYDRVLGRPVAPEREVQALSVVLDNVATR